MEKLNLDLDKNTLFFLYFKKKLSAIDIAKKYDCGTTTIYRLMNRFEIKRRTASEVKLGDKKKPSKGELFELYITKKMSINSISKKLNLNWFSIKTWLIGYKIRIKKFDRTKFMTKIRNERWEVKENKEKQRKIMKKWWKNDEYKEKVVKNSLKGLLKRPTSLEKKFIEFIEKYDLPFKYTGNGTFLIGYKNPDFVCITDKKVCIEVANEYHHPPPYATKRVKHFAKWGWKCLIFFQNDKTCEFWASEEEMLQQIQQILGKSI